MKTRKRTSPWAWIPTLYFAEGIPYVVVMAISTVMYKRLGLGNAEIALYTSWLYLPWVIKPFWSPFVDLIRTKRWWVVAMQLLVGAALGGVAFTLNLPSAVQWTLGCFWLMAFSSATHDIAADGYYMLALDSHEQAFYVGIRSTFYRVATIAGQGILIMLAGVLEVYTRSVPYAWSLTFYLTAALFLGLCLYHQCVLPRPASDDRRTVAAGHIAGEFLDTFVSFFRKPGIGVALLFMLLYRFPEAMLTKICPLFMLESKGGGGLGLSTSELGFVQGTVGVIGLTLGGIVGGLAAARGGLKKWLWPMVWSISLPNAVYIYLSYFQPTSFFAINACVFVEQFGYGFGFTAYMLYMLYFSQGRNQTAHYAICTAFMAAGMMLPGMLAGWLQEHVGYLNFFILVLALCLVTVVVARLIRVDPKFGIKE